jgi:hypothetical protein
VAEAEGVIKFNLQFKQKTLPPGPELDELLVWRNRFFELGIIGHDPERYHGDAFGNISCRIAGSNAFLISGSQSGKYPHALPEHFACVDSFELLENRIEAHGPIQPSSESMTHGAIYSMSPAIRCVVHGHCPPLWNRTSELGLPSTPRSVAYGTTDMAHAIAHLYRENGEPELAIFCMLGHEDGIIAYGEDFSAIEQQLRRDLARVTDNR